MDLNRRSGLVERICRDVGPAGRGSDLLAFEAKVWRAVISNVPALGADETMALTTKILSAYAEIAGQPRQRRTRQQRRQAA